MPSARDSGRSVSARASGRRRLRTDSSRDPGGASSRKSDEGGNDGSYPSAKIMVQASGRNAPKGVDVGRDNVNSNRPKPSSDKRDQFVTEEKNMISTGDRTERQAAAKERRDSQLANQHL